MAAIVSPLMGDHAQEPVDPSIHDAAHLECFFERYFRAVFAGRVGVVDRAGEVQRDDVRVVLDPSAFGDAGFGNLGKVDIFRDRLRIGC